MNMKSKDSDQNLIEKGIEIYQTEGIMSLFARSGDFVYYDLWRPIRTQIMQFGDKHGFLGPDEIYKTQYYAKRIEDPWRSEANQIGIVLMNYFEPESVIDFGCAVGAHLEPFHKNNIAVQGVEGNKKGIEYAVIPKKYISHHDLRKPFDSNRKYDLAISIEVAEHIPQQFDDVYVNSICASASNIVITAAPPGQGGTHHVNEQPNEYWIDKFERRGFSYRENANKELAAQFEVSNSTWVEENLLIFKEE